MIPQSFILSLPCVTTTGSNGWYPVSLLVATNLWMLERLIPFIRECSRHKAQNKDLLASECLWKGEREWGTMGRNVLSRSLAFRLPRRSSWHTKQKLIQFISNFIGNRVLILQCSVGGWLISMECNNCSNCNNYYIPRLDDKRCSGCVTRKSCKWKGNSITWALHVLGIISFISFTVKPVLSNSMDFSYRRKTKSLQRKSFWF